MNTGISNHSGFDKALLFVNDDLLLSATVTRIAEFNGLRIQIAHSASSALSFLEHKPRDYFLVVVDEAVANFQNQSLLDVVVRKWPHLNRIAISQNEIARSHEASGQVGRILKPVSDKVLSSLMIAAREEFLARNISLRKTILERQQVLNNCIVLSAPDLATRDLFLNYASSYFSACEKGWSQTGRYENRVFTQDSEQFQAFLHQRVLRAIEKVCSKCIGDRRSKNVRLAPLLQQFGIVDDRQCIHSIVANEPNIVAMFSILKDYYSILGYELSSVIHLESNVIKCDLGGRFVYNDLFNPLLSSVEKGVELACLKLEFIMLAYLSNLDIRIHFDNKYFASIVI